MSRNSSLHISVVAIVVYWLYIFLIKINDVPSDPSIGLIVINKILTLAVVYALLRLNGDNFQSLGFHDRSVIKQLLYGTGFGLVLWMFIHLMFNPLLDSVLSRVPGEGMDMSVYFKDPVSALIWVCIGVFGGGLTEEIQRIFVLTRFQKWLGGTGLVLALLISSVAFGAGHLYQGFNTAIGAGLTGLIFGLVYLRKRSALEAVTCHAVFDVIGIVAVFVMNKLQ